MPFRPRTDAVHADPPQRRKEGGRRPAGGISGESALRRHDDSAEGDVDTDVRRCRTKPRRKKITKQITADVPRMRKAAAHPNQEELT